METEELYQIQSEVEVETVVGYALSTGREVQFCLLLHCSLSWHSIDTFSESFLTIFFHFLLGFKTFQKGTSNCSCS